MRDSKIEFSDTVLTVFLTKELRKAMMLLPKLKNTLSKDNRCNWQKYIQRNCFLNFLKAHRQISKKRYFEKYCSCDQACQFSAS